MLSSVAAVLLGATAVIVAAAPTFWTVSRQAEFLEGDIDNLSIDSDGRVVLGPPASLLAETSAPFLWTVVPGPDGSFYAGSGNEGKVLKIAADGRTTTFFDAPELEVHALVPAPRGGLYVATSPDGRIYEVASDGTSKTLFDPDDKYIWALAVDRSGNVFAATGDKGVIYKISPDGTGSRFYKANATNVVSLAIAPGGELIAGTESPGRIFRLDASGKPFVLLDSPYKEIHALRVADDGTIYAAAMSATPPSSGDRPATPPAVDVRPAAANAADTATGGTDTPTPAPSVTVISTSTGRQRGGRGAIYRVRPDGFWDSMWETGDDVPYDLLVEPGGSILVATGTEGKIFRIAGEPARATLLARAAARQVTALLREPSGRIVGATSNPGKIVALGATPALRGTYESDVRDAGTTAKWGIIRWRASGERVEIATRSGNTATPDETWSAWSEPYRQADGQQIVSPAARYVQFRAVLSREGNSPGPTLTSVTTAYLPRNLRPEVASITVHPAGAVFQRPFSTGDPEIAGYEDNSSDGRQPNQPQGQAVGPGGGAPPAPALGRRLYQKGLQTIVWKAEDDNDDRLQFDVLYRREGETVWKPLRRGVWDPIVVWDTTSVPDGTYLVKVVASDAPSNSPETTLTGEMESTTFDVDNTPPTIAVAAGAPRGSVAFTVQDAQSAIRRVEYSLDASRWRAIYPEDGIPDSRREEFALTLPAGESARSVIVRATDAMNNVATAVIDVARAQH